jgi:ABC-type dipeptide/oligopeptide/nickel transport system ATPase component
LEIYALVGGSGTGKSHRAVNLAYSYQLDAIIDDGLLIKDGKILAGRSAKKEPNKLRAVYRAIFTDAQHQEEVREAIAQLDPERILVIGTSSRMIKKIVTALNLPEPVKTIMIEDISTERERRTAKEIRVKEGKHTIPVATIEVKKKLSGLFVDPAEIFFRLKPQSPLKKIGEQSIVRPSFSYIGKLLISENVIAALVEKGIANVSGFAKGKGISVQLREEGVIVELQGYFQYGEDLVTIATRGQQQIREEIEYLTGLNVIEVNILIKGVVV